MKYGYARCSTSKQDLEAQVTRLRAEGCERIFSDFGVSGTKASRPDWDRLTDPERGPLRAGDVVVFTKLDRIGRSIKHLLEIAEDFRERDINLQSLDQGLFDTTTPVGKMVYGILGLVAEFQRDLIASNTKDALAVRTARGRKGGRKRKLNPEQEQLVAELYALADENGVRKYSGSDLAVRFKVSRSVIYETLNPARRENARKARRDRYERGKQAQEPGGAISTG